LAAALGILNGDNTCSTFFNAAAGGSAAAMLSSEAIVSTDKDPNTGKPLSAGVGAVSVQNARADSTIWINPNGAFFKSSGIVDFKMVSLSIGGYSGGSLREQVLEIFHELGHMTNAIPRDAGKPSQSNTNTNTILQHCAPQINQLP
jgi:hypothetical protein